jgi:hypothetical protein
LCIAVNVVVDNKKTRSRAGFLLYETGEVKTDLLQLGLFIHHMLASFGIKFHDLHFLRHGAFVFAGGIEMTGAST